MVWGLGELPYRSPYPRSSYSTEGEALGLLRRMFKIASPSAFSYTRNAPKLVRGAVCNHPVGSGPSRALRTFP